uniref:Uncharacterized protein n=1 Tax=Anopheles dirus TaxID=7168 RepID=A0A182MYK1_9DIPT
MADGAIPGYCTLPRPSADSANRPQVTDRGHFYTLRPQPAAMGTTGGRLSPKQSHPEDDRAESNRNLLYEQNMSTFENFCERRNSEQRLHQHHTEDDCSPDTGREGLANFCTLRKVHRSRHGAECLPVQRPAEAPQPLGGAYCTLKKKKLQLNRKFVESFLEDPNAKVVDYLSELDAYLDEMDGVDDACDSGASESDSVGGSDDRTPSPGAFTDETSQKNACEAAVADSLQYYQKNVRHNHPASNDLYQEDRIKFGDIKHFCTLPKQKRTQFLNAFKRGASVRRTIVGEPVAASDGERTPAGAQIPATRLDTNFNRSSLM